MNKISPEAHERFRGYCRSLVVRTHLLGIMLSKHSSAGHPCGFWPGTQMKRSYLKWMVSSGKFCSSESMQNTLPQNEDFAQFPEVLCALRPMFSILLGVQILILVRMLEYLAKRRELIKGAAAYILCN